MKKLDFLAFIIVLCALGYLMQYAWYKIIDRTEIKPKKEEIQLKDTIYIDTCLGTLIVSYNK